MAWDGSICELPVKKQAEIVLSRIEVGDTKAGVKFSLAGTAKKGKYYSNVSEAAFKLIKKEHPEVIQEDRIAEYEFGRRLCVEHVIPTEVVYSHLMECNKVGKLDVRYIMKIMDKLSCAVITHEEDVILGKVMHLKKKMPKGWTFEDGDVFARYIDAGIKMHEW